MNLIAPVRRAAMRCTWTMVVGLVGIGGFPALAQAATVQIGADPEPGDTAPLTVDYAIYTAAKHERNRLTVKEVRDRGFDFVDRRTSIRAKRQELPRCMASRHSASCRDRGLFETATGEPPLGTNLIVNLGDLNDRVSLARVPDDGTGGPTIDVGLGDDTVVGSAGKDQISGGPGADRLNGGNGDDKIEGGAGADRVDGGPGNDHLAAAETLPGGSDAGPGAADALAGGPGDDVLDGRDHQLGATKTLDCGPGNDTVITQTDNLVDASCERAAYVVGGSVVAFVPVHPVSFATDGSPVFDVPCPAAVGRATTAGCTGTLTLERPGTTDVLGTGAFDTAPRGHAQVAVTLNPAGVDALAANQPLTVHLTATLAAADGSSAHADFGWQTALK